MEFMRVEAVDERDSSWEDHEPRFRVYLFLGDGRYSVATWDVREADVLETTLWAQQKAGADALYAVALVGETSPDKRAARGQTWLVGMDANDHPSDAVQQQVLARMQGRRGKQLVRSA